MASRFYLPATGTAPVSITPSSHWTTTTGFATLPAPTTKSNTATAAGTARAKSGTSPEARLDRVYVSDSLAAQTIAAGTFSAVIKGLESGTSTNAWLDIAIRVVSSDGATERGVVYAGSPSVTESATVTAEAGEFVGTAPAATRIKSALTTTAVTAQQGDRVVIEVGYKARSTNTGNNATLTYGDPTGSADFALTAGLTTDLCPWVELSADLTFDAGGPATQTLTGTGIGDPTVFGAGAVTPGAATVTGTGLATSEAFGAGAVASSITAAGTGIASGEALGVGSVAGGPVTLAGTGIASSEAVGAGSATPGATALAGTGIGSGEAVGAAVVTSTRTLAGTGIPSAEAVGAGTVTSGPVALTGVGIPSGEGLGAGSASTGGALLVGAGIPSSEVVGAGVVTSGAVTVAGTGIPSGEALGAGLVSTGGALLAGSGIVTAEAFGSGTVTPGPRALAGVGIPSSEALGAGSLTPNAVVLTGVGVGSAEQLGTGTVTSAGADGYHPLLAGVAVLASAPPSTAVIAAISPRTAVLAEHIGTAEIQTT